MYQNYKLLPSAVPNGMIIAVKMMSYDIIAELFEYNYLLAINVLGNR